MRTCAILSAGLFLVSACSRGAVNAGNAAHGGEVAHPYDLTSGTDVPVAFGDARVTTVNGLAFTPNGRTLYTANWVADRDSTGRQRLRIFEWVFRDGAWQGPTPASFSSAFTDYQPVMAPGGARLYFQSTRPLPGSSAEVLQNIWYVDREGDAWSSPRFAADLNTPAREGYVAALASGAIYFNSDRPGTRGLQDFYRSRALDGGRFEAPTPVLELNTMHSENDLVVDPLGRFVIFNRYVEATKDIDLYIAFPSGPGWAMPRPLDGVNGPGWELTPSISPNGRYFFFTRGMKIFQVDLDTLLYNDEPVRGRRRRAS
jgi:hypothetical protein